MIIGELLALFTAFCWAQNSVFYSITGKRVTSSTTAHIRLWITLPFMFLIHFIFYKSIYPIHEPLPAYIYIALSGIFGYFFADLMIFKSFVDLGPRETTVILTLSPIFSAILSYFFFNQNLSVLKISGMFLTILGIIIVIIGDSPEYKNNKKKFYKAFKINKGIVIAFLGALGQSLGLVLAKMGQNYGTTPISTNTIRITFALIAYIFYRGFTKNFKKDFLKMKDKKSFVLIMIGSVVGPILGVIAALYAINYAPIGIVSTIMQIVPILLLPYEYFVLKKKITLLSINGTILAVIGTAILFL